MIKGLVTTGPQTALRNILQLPPRTSATTPSVINEQKKVTSGGKEKDIILPSIATTLISLQLSPCGSDGDTALGLVTHLQDQTNGKGNSKEESQAKPEEEVELDREIDLVTVLATVLGVVDLGALAVVAVGGLTENTGSLLAASSSVGLAVGLGLETVSCSWQSALENITRCRALREHFRSLTSVGGHQEDGRGVGLVNLLKLGKEGLQRGKEN
jgi:hypothetical protein